MRLWMVICVVAMGSFPACKGSAGGNVKGKMDRAHQEREAEAEREKAAEEQRQLEQQEAAEERNRLREEAEAKRIAELPAGNEKTTDEITQDETELEIVAELERAGTYTEVAARIKRNRERYEPLILKALRHQAANVRTQSALVLMENEWKSEAVTAAWIEALNAEKDEILCQNWGLRLRTYNDPATIPALHRAFRRSVQTGARGELAMTLAMMGHEDVLEDLYPVLEGAGEETLLKVKMLNAMSKIPRETSRSHAERYLADRSDLVRHAAKEVIEALDSAQEETAP